MSRFYNLDQAPFNSRELSKAIVTAITRQYNGAYFDAQDLGTMFQDAAGTTPVTAMEQPVGLWLDKSGNGNHATQSITASRPVISARKNLLTKTEDFADAYWFKTNVTNPASSVTAGFALSPSGMRDAALFTPGISGNAVGVTAGTANRLFYESGSTATAAYSGSIYVKSHQQNTQFGIYVINKATDSVRASTVVTTTSEWTRIVVTGSSIGCRFLISSSYPVLIWHPQLEYGPVATSYQRVNTATDYDTAGFPKYLKFDGVDDYLNLPYMGLYANGSASIVAARDALSQATDTYVISERSTSNVNPKYFPSRQLANAGNMDAYIVNDAAAVVADTVGSAYGGASEAVIRSVVDSGNNIKLFKNGALAANDNYTRSGTLTLTNTTIGASVSTTTSNYANMKLYGLAITKSALSDSERRRVERLLAYNSGAQI